jgi:hypothetical protein
MYKPPLIRALAQTRNKYNGAKAKKVCCISIPRLKSRVTEMQVHREFQVNFYFVTTCFSWWYNVQTPTDKGFSPNKNKCNGAKAQKSVLHFNPSTKVEGYEIQAHK